MGGVGNRGRACIVAVGIVLACGTTPAASFDLEGHRGARGLAPENTMAAFRRALGIGVTTIETDLAITRDLVPVMSHDPRLNPDLVRGPDGHWLATHDPPIHALTLAELRRYDIGRLDPRTKYARGFPAQTPADGERFPTFGEVLQLVKHSATAVRLNVEIKTTPDNEGETVDPATFARLALADIDAARMRDRVTIQSFDWRALEAMKALAPEIPRSCLTMESAQMNTMTAGADGRSPWHAGLRLADYDSVPALVEAAGCAIWSPFYRNVTGNLIERAHALGLRVLPWTVNDPGEMRHLIDLGADGLITDYPDRLRAVMGERGMPLP